VTRPLRLLERHKVITTLITIVAATVASSQPLRFHSEISLNNIDFYTAPPKKLKTSQHYVIIASKVNISNLFKKRTKKGRVPRFPLRDDPIKYLGWLRLSKLFYIAFLNIPPNKIPIDPKAFNKYKDIYKNVSNS